MLQRSAMIFIGESSRDQDAKKSGGLIPPESVVKVGHVLVPSLPTLFLVLLKNPSVRKMALVSFSLNSKERDRNIGLLILIFILTEMGILMGYHCFFSCFHGI